MDLPITSRRVATSERGKSGIELADHSLNRQGKRFHIVRGANHNRGRTVIVSIDRPIDGRHDGLCDIPSGIADNTDNFVDLAAFFGSDVLSDRILTLEQDLCAATADDRNVGPLKPLIQGKDAGRAGGGFEWRRSSLARPRAPSSQAHPSWATAGVRHLHHAIAIPAFTRGRATSPAACTPGNARTRAITCSKKETCWAGCL